MPLVSIVIPNYNGSEHLEVCLDSIENQRCTDYEIIIVDNGSSDQSIAYLKSRKQKISIFEFGENKGFAAAVNYGIQHATGQFIALLNNDIELEPLWLSTMMQALESDESLGSTACKMLNYYDRTMIDAAGDILTKAGNIIGRGYGEKDHGQFDSSEFVFGACAGAGLYRKDVFEHVGLLDEDYFAWFEDADHHFRSQMLGYRCQYVPDARCYHKRGATAKKMSALSVRLHARNHLFFQMINIPATMYWTNIIYIAASRLKNWATIIIQGDGKALIWAFGEVIRGFRHILKKRSRIQKSRTVSINYLRAQCR